MPASLAAGDLVIVAFANDGDATVTTPNGWTQLFSAAQSTNVRCGAYAHIYAGGDPSTVDFVTSAAEQAAAQAIRITGWYGNITDGVVARTPETNALATVNPSDITPAWGAADTLWIPVISDSSAATLDSVPYGNGSLISATSGAATTGAQVYTQHRGFNAATENVGVFTFSVAGAHVYSTVAVRPTAPGVTLTPTTGTGAATGATTALTKQFAPGAGQTSASGAVPTISRQLQAVAGSSSASGAVPAVAKLIGNNTGWLPPVTTGDHSGIGSNLPPYGDGSAAWYNNGAVRYVGEGGVSYIGASNIGAGVWTDWLYCNNFLNSIPTDAIITGVEVRINIAETSGQMVLERVCLRSEGFWIEESLKEPAEALTGSFQTLTYGAFNDKWSSPLTPTFCADDRFSAAIQCQATAADTNAAIDFIQMRIHFAFTGIEVAVERGAVAASGNAPGITVNRDLSPSAGAGNAIGSQAALSKAFFPASSSVGASGNSTALGIDLVAVAGLASATGAVLTILQGLRLHPSSLAASTNLTGTFTAITDDPDAPDGSWLTAVSATASTDVRIAFDDPALPPGGEQSFVLLLRKTAGAPNPTVTISLYQNGTFRADLLTNLPITSTTGQRVVATWDASQLATVLDGSDVECRILCTPGQA